MTTAPQDTVEALPEEHLLRRPAVSNLDVEQEPLEEDSDIAVREKLGFREVYYESQPAQHPDPNPCPPWCWVATDGSGDYAHEVDYAMPTRATHSLEGEPTTVASLYRGDHQEVRPGEWMIHAATIDTSLTQLSAREPMIKLTLRDWPDAANRHKQRYSERLRLTVTDARELITALQYVCDIAEDKP